MNEEKYSEARKMLCKYLFSLAREKGITQEQIAEKTGFKRSNVSRMLSGAYSSSLDNFIKLAEAIDTYFFIIDKKADDDLVETMKNRWGKIGEN
ncbi:MAG: helix-turn-helix transcriptional regulator [Bacteroidales bacterium]|nr:helix-turn-helix transcriptional regulator [Bacteroidales bacterium]